MKITLRQPLAFSEIGKKDNQEDRVYPAPDKATAADRTFILCDGMGGHDNGEVASATVCQALGSYLDAHRPADGILTPEQFNEALSHAYDELDRQDTYAPKKMGTTMTCLCLHRNGYLVAHIGDSRIYQFRRGEVVYQTEDHSLVNAYIKLGRITPAEAATHPQRNVILRAIQGSKQPVEAEVVTLSDILPGDYFFLCTDGVLQECPTEVLGEIFATSTSAMEIKIRIAERCAGHTRDNFSFYLVPVRNVKTADTPARGILSFFYSLI